MSLAGRPATFGRIGNCSTSARVVWWLENFWGLTKPSSTKFLILSTKWLGTDGGGFSGITCCCSFKNGFGIWERLSVKNGGFVLLGWG